MNREMNGHPGEGTKANVETSGDPAAAKVRETLRWAVVTIGQMLKNVPDESGKVEGPAIVRMRAEEKEIVDRVVTFLRPAVAPLKLRLETDPADSKFLLLTCQWPATATIAEATIEEN